MKKMMPLFKLTIMCLFVIGVPVFLYLVYPEFIEQFRTVESVNEFLVRYEVQGIFVYAGIQILQVLISVIPGQLIQFGGGYAFGFWPGYLLAVLGIGVGTVLTFYLARFLGRDAMHVIFGEKRITKFIDHLNSKRAFAIIFVIYVIPGIPKDLLTYAAGVSEFRLRTLLILSLTGRTPAMMITIMMGSMLRDNSYVGMLIMGVLSILFFVFCIINRHHLTEYADRIYKRLNR